MYIHLDSKYQTSQRLFRLYMKKLEMTAEGTCVCVSVHTKPLSKNKPLFSCETVPQGLRTTAWPDIALHWSPSHSIMNCAVLQCTNAPDKIELCNLTMYRKYSALVTRINSLIGLFFHLFSHCDVKLCNKREETCCLADPAIYVSINGCA